VKFIRLLTILIFSFTLLNLTGCLATEYKEYIFKLDPDGSGEGTITFHNIVSVEDDEKDVSFKDFGELVSDYMEGTRFEDDNPDYVVTNKELFEEDSILIGKVEFTFTDFRNIGFFKSEDCDCSPLMYYMGDFGETYSESNGNYLGDEKDFPVIIWQSDADEIYIKTIVQEDLTGTHSLLKLYRTWKDSQ
jgi:hypothetical protein